MRIQISREWAKRVSEDAKEANITPPQYIRQAILEKWYREHGPEAK